MSDDDALATEYAKLLRHAEDVKIELAEVSDERDRLRANLHRERAVKRINDLALLNAIKERDRLRAVARRLIEIDDQRTAVVLATQHEDINVGVQATVPIMAEYRAAMRELREQLDATPTGEDT